MRAAWRCKYLKLSRFVDPTVIPGVDESPELTRTALMSRWLMSDSCESMMKKEELEEFFYDDAVIPSIAISIFNCEPAPPEDMGFFAPGCKKLENREQRKKFRKP